MTPKIHYLVCATCDKAFEWKWSREKRGRPPRRCEDCIRADPKGRKLQKMYDKERVTLTRMSTRFSEFDKSELGFIQERMGASAIEAIRTSIRVYAAMLRRGP